MREGQPVHGKTDEFSKIYMAYFDDVYKAVYRRIPNRQIAEDIVQDTFLVAFKLGGEFLKHPEPKLWLFRTAHYKMLELYRRMKRRAAEPLEEERLELAKEDCRYGEIELDMAALAAISAEEWRMIKAYYLAGTTITELAESEAITENHMRVRLFRFRRKLKETIKR